MPLCDFVVCQPGVTPAIHEDTTIRGSSSTPTTAPIFPVPRTSYEYFDQQKALGLYRQEQERRRMNDLLAGR